MEVEKEVEKEMVEDKMEVEKEVEKEMVED